MHVVVRGLEKMSFFYLHRMGRLVHSVNSSVFMCHGPAPTGLETMGMKRLEERKTSVKVMIRRERERGPL